MSPERLATLTDVGKRYVKYEDTPTLLTGLRRSLGRRGRRRRIWAVRNVNLEIDRGDALGIIGRNGSGKSTTLAMLAGITAPTEGTVRVNGRMAPLLKLGVGFHPELTGRENVYINGMMLGVGRREIDESFDEIVEFSEISEFVDTPVKFYSTGMQVRLGFASAISTRPDLLLVDEVLSVGDIGFQVKSFERMQEMRERGTTLLFVSHNISAIRRLSDEVLVLHDGAPRFQGEPDEAISVYHDLLRVSASVTTDDDAGAPVQVESLELFDADDQPTAHVVSGEEVTLRLHARFVRDVEAPRLGVYVLTDNGQFAYADNSLVLGEGRTFHPGEEARCEVRLRMSLVTGTYLVGAGVRWGEDRREHVRAPEKTFYVSGRPLVGGVADLGASFDVG